MNERTLGRAATVLALGGLAVSAYLTYVHYADIEPICATGGGGCERVQASKYAEFAGIPVALLGLIGYGLILASLRLESDGARALTLVLVLGGAAFSAYLAYLELFVIDAICQWCLASAVIMLALLGVAGARWVNSAGS